MKNKKIIYVILGVLAIFVVFFAYKENRYKPINGIKYFEYSYFGGWVTKDNVYYKVECNDKCKANIRTAESETKEVTLDDETVDGLVELLNKYRVSKWDGYNRRSSSTDLAGFNLTINTNDNKDIKASGYGYFPKNHERFKEELNELFSI